MTSKIKVDNINKVSDDSNIINKCGTTVTVGAASDGVRTGANNLQASDGGNLISQSGTTITLGASGDTINLASGASQSGFGRAGTVDWETVTSPEFGYDSAQGNSTDGLIDPVTNVVKTQLPPNSRSFILGPLVDGFVPNHISDAFTRIGYIEKDTRQFVLLASFTGEWISGLNGYGGVPTWNGTSTGFTQVNPNFTLDMALWFRNEMLKNRFVKNVSYNAVGGIPQLGNPDPDSPQPLGGNGVGGGSGEAGGNPDGTGTGHGSGGDPDVGTPQGDPDPGKDPGGNNLWGLLSDLAKKGKEK